MEQDVKFSAYAANDAKEIHDDGIPELLKVMEAAKYIGVSKEHFYRLIQIGILPPVNIGGRWRVSRTYLDKLVIPKLWQESEGFDSYSSWIESSPNIDLES